MIKLFLFTEQADNTASFSVNKAANVLEEQFSSTKYPTSFLSIITSNHYDYYLLKL